LISASYWYEVSAHLKAANLIKSVRLRNSNSSDERGTRADLYWLTPLGILQSIVTGAPLGSLRSWVRKIGPDVEEGETLMEMAQDLGRDWIAIALSISEGTSVSITGSSLDTAKFAKFAEILKRHPKHLKAFAMVSPQLAASLKQLVEVYSVS
jgi:hypothetical protein